MGQVYYTPVPAGDKVYVLASFGKLRSLDLGRNFCTSGYKNPKEETLGLGEERQCFSDNSIYAHSSKEDPDEVFIQAMEASSGNHRWKYKLEDGANQSYYPKAVGPNRVYVQSRRTLIALEESTGSPAWIADLRIRFSALSYIDGILYGIGSSEEGFGFFAIRATQ